MSIFKKYSYWVNSGKFTAFQKFSTLIMGIISFMLLARILGPSGFGTWGLFLVISSITETARTALIRNAFIRFINKSDHTEHPSLQGSAFLLSSFISAGLAILFLALAYPAATWLKAPGLAIMLQIYAIAMIVCVFFAHFEMLLNAKMDFKGVCWMYCMRQGSLVLLIAICFVFKTQVNFLILSLFYLFSLVAGSIIGFQFSIPYLKLDIRDYRKWMKELWLFGRYVFGTNIFSLLFRSTDNFITSNKFGPGVSGYYNASLRIGNLVDLPSQVLGDILFPKAAKFDAAAIGDKGAIKNMYEKTVGAILLFSIPSLIVILAVPGPILYILAGKNFIVASSILRITAFFGFTLPFLKQFGTIMDATGKPQLNALVMFCAFVFNIGANMTGVYYFGVIGAALGTLTTYSCLFVVTQLIMYKKFGVTPLNIFKSTMLLYKELFVSFRSFLKAKPSTPVS
ncbi:MAG TPA: oligosaccharide flippase family protein [Puia sp.]|nr:oligosaccharide flippase family protein [Puia sp.]